MKRGLLLGKFMPLHLGHEHLIRTALEHCDMLTILVCSLEREPIPGSVRHDWMEMTFPQARCIDVRDEVPQEPAEHPEFWDIWRNLVKKYHPENIDVVFSSELYGYQLAEEVGAVHHLVDLDRKTYPISGTAIRENPYENWDFLSAIVRPYFTKGILITGPESTGKSTFTQQLADYFDTIGVQEYAREWIDNHEGNWSYEDLDIFAIVQEEGIYWARQRANKVFFADTNAIATEIFSLAYFQKVSSTVRSHVRFANTPGHIKFAFLMDIDCPWVDDGQRDFPDPVIRRFMFNEHERYLIERDIPYMKLSGTWPQKFAAAVNKVEELLNR
jgi:HTH-type transcriptional repressor of NAD biosynthesis genes